MDEIVRFLQRYACVSEAPIETHTRVMSVTVDGRGYRVGTDRGDFTGRNIVLATGACSVAQLPAISQALPSHINQLTPLQYCNPAQLSKGGVLVVGASASGVQLAAEIRKAGHEVMLSVGQHIRMPRRYRGRDIQWWMEQTGVLDTTLDGLDDIERARRVPSLQLSGSLSTPLMDLNYLQSLGVEITGRLQEIRNGEALFSGSLANQCALSDLKMNRFLADCDAWVNGEPVIPAIGDEQLRSEDNAGTWGNRGEFPPSHRFEETRIPAQSPLQYNVSDGRIRTVLWATGYKPDFSYLRLPVFDRKGRLRHEAGMVAPGLYVLGLPFMRCRKSALIDGVGNDARVLADHLIQHEDSRVA